MRRQEGERESEKDTHTHTHKYMPREREREIYREYRCKGDIRKRESPIVIHKEKETERA